MSLRIWSILLLLAMAFSAMGQQASTIREIVIRGNQRVSRDAILAAMQTKVGQPYVQATLDKDRRNIEDLGFFSAVDVRAIPLDKGDYQVIVDVSENPVIKEIRIEGNSVLKPEQILSVVTLKPGEVFNLKAQRPTARAVEQLYSKRGYFAAVDSFAPTAGSPGTITLSIIEMRISKVSVQGNRETKDYVFRRLIKSKAGDAFNINKWQNDIRRVNDTQWFENVRSVIDDQSEPGKVGLTAVVKEARTGTFNVGLQVDPRSSFAGVLKLSESNLKGTGQSVGVDYVQAINGGGASLGLDYSNPFYDARDTSFRASVYSRLIYRFSSAFGSNVPLANDNQFFERRTGTTFGWVRPLNDNVSVGLSGRFERVLTENPQNIGAGVFIQQDGDVGVLSTGITLDRRDTRIDASRGDFWKWDVEPGYSNITSAQGAPSTTTGILGQSIFFRSTLEYRKYWTKQPARGLNLDEPRKVLALRARVGGVAEKIPFYEQYFVGGSQTLRGYDEDRYWGRNMFASTLEYRHPIQSSFNAVLFMDYAGAWGGYGTVNNFDQNAAFRLHLGYGAGVSFRTPLGPIQLYFGFGEHFQSRTHFLIGSSF